MISNLLVPDAIWDGDRMGSCAIKMSGGLTILRIRIDVRGTVAAGGIASGSRKREHV
jgi:hypothetical protein